MEYKFYGWDNIDVKPINSKYSKIKNHKDLYDILSGIWCEYTCAPRMRDKWSADNKTVGQCSITAFLFQDIFGGDVYGVELNDGNYHCYNVVNENQYDLTSEQFDYELIYDNINKQSRDVHFSKEEKYERYKYLSEELEKYL